jgi:hypothetical protein
MELEGQMKTKRNFENSQKSQNKSKIEWPTKRYAQNRIH